MRQNSVLGTKYMADTNLGHSGLKPHGSQGNGQKFAFIKALAEVNIAAATGAAIMLFLVASVSSATLIIHRELSSNVSASALGKAQAKSQVMGLATYGYQQPVCANNVCLRYELLPQSNNSFAANVFYFSQNTNALRGSIKVRENFGRFNKFVYNIREGGITSTGYGLKPGQTYKFNFYSGASGTGRILNTLEITMPNIDSGVVCPSRPAPPEGCYYNNSTSCGGELVCNSKLPSYGYSTANVGPIASGSWREGWLENVTYGSNQEPGSVKISGWVYDAGNNITYNSLSVALRNNSTGVTYRPTDISIESTARADVQSYLAGKRNANANFISNIYSFTIKFESLPAGGYYVDNGKYNGYLFNIHQGNAYQPIVISGKDKPTYGYGGALQIIFDKTNSDTRVSAGASQAALFGFQISNAGGSGPFALSSVTFMASSDAALQSVGEYAVTDEFGSIVGKYDPYVKPTKQYGYNVIFSPALTINVNQVRYLQFKANINTNASGSFQFQPWGTGYPYPYPSGYSYPGRIDGLNSLWSQTITVVPGNVIQNTPNFTVSYPNGGETLQAGQTYTIRWPVVAGFDTVDLGLYKGNSCVSATNSYFSLCGNLQTFSRYTNILSVPNTGSYSWTVPADAANGNDYYISIGKYNYNAGTWQYVGHSASPFSISYSTPAKPTISVTSPGGGETFVKGESYKISWNAKGTSNFYLKLRRATVGDTVAAIPLNSLAASQKIGEGTVYYSMDWTVPQDLVDGNDYSVRVLSYDNTGVYDDSDNYFSIVTRKSAVSAPKITGVQGYDHLTGAYANNTIASGKYMILYGSFSSNGDNVPYINRLGQEVVYQSSGQINVRLGTLSGKTVAVEVSNKLGGFSNVVTVDVSSLTVAPTPTPTPTPPTPTPTPAPSSITGIQGYDSSTGTYSNNTISSNKYLILYGSFASGGNTVVVSGQTYTPSYQSGTQINVQLGSVSGSTASVTVQNSGGNSNTMTVNVASTAPTPTPTPSVPAPSIKGLQGYNSSGGYSTSISSNGYLIIYGSFAATGNTVTINGASQNVTYQSTSQINVQLGDLSGLPPAAQGSSAFVKVSNANGVSNEMYIAAIGSSASSTPTPTPTPTPSVPAPSIAGMQGYSSSSGYSTSISSNQYLILYGTFADSGNTVTINGVSQNVTYQSTSQINVHLGSVSGSTASVVVSNSNGSSNSSSIPVQ